MDPGWWLRPTPLKKKEFINWDDEIPNTVYGQLKSMFQSTNQDESMNDGRLCGFFHGMIIIGYICSPLYMSSFNVMFSHQ